MLASYCIEEFDVPLGVECAWPARMTPRLAAPAPAAGRPPANPRPLEACPNPGPVPPSNAGH